MARYDAEWRDEKILLLGEPVPGIRAAVPPACFLKEVQNGAGLPIDPEGRYPKEVDRPGLWLPEHGPHGSGGPGMAVTHNWRLLDRTEAESIAGAFDLVAHPDRQPVCNLGEDDVAGGPIDTYVALVEAWYEVLGRRLALAVTAAQDHVADLRESRAAITGRAS